MTSMVSGVVPTLITGKPGPSQASDARPLGRIEHLIQHALQAVQFGKDVTGRLEGWIHHHSSPLTVKR
jgi:hypothetical protein